MEWYKKPIQVLLVFVFLILICASPAAGTITPNFSDSVRILFVGNSYTYYNHMPQMVKALAKHQFPGRYIETKFVGGGGATLKQHWESGDAVKEITTGRWNYVVLQGQSMLGTGFETGGKQYFGTPEPFFTYAGKFAQAIKQHDGEPVFFMTWSRKHYPQHQKYLTYAYMQMARELDSKIAPVGVVWDSLRTVDHFDLYQKDGSHPSVHGSYLAAVMLFTVIFDTVPEGLPGRLLGYKILRGGSLAAEKSLLCILPKKEAAIIQHAAAAVYKKMQQKGGYLDVEKTISKRRPSLLSQFYNALTYAEGQAAALLIIVIFWLLVKGSLKLYSRHVSPKAE